MGFFSKIENFFENLQNDDLNEKETKTPTKCSSCGATIKGDSCEYCGAVYETSNEDDGTSNFNEFKKDMQSAANKFGKLVNKLFVSDEEFKSNLEDKDE